MQLSCEGPMLGAVTVANHGLSKELTMSSFFFFLCLFFMGISIYLFIFDCTGSLFLELENKHESFPSCSQ